MIVTVIFTVAAVICLLLFENIKLKCHQQKQNDKNPFFLIGTLLLVFAWLRILVRSFNSGTGHTMRIIIGIVLVVAAVLFYIYILFLALPKNTYGDAQSDYELMDAGIYGLCRHPGFYGFTFLAISLAVVDGSKAGWIAAAVYSALNLGYIYLQDIYFFPGYLPGYEEYKKRVPFLAFWKQK